LKLLDNMAVSIATAIVTVEIIKMLRHYLFWNHSNS
jgi:hypothetical protein